MELKWLEDVIALADCGSFSRAAETRGVSQPAFSRRVRTMEAWVGADLFLRTSHGVEPTAAGAEFLRGADDLRRRILLLRAHARERGAGEAQALRFAATHALSATFFPRWVGHANMGERADPIRLISDSMAACEQLMLRGSVDFLLCHHAPNSEGSWPPDGFTSVKVGDDVMIACAAPDAVGGPRWRLDESREVPLLSYSAESGLGAILRAHHFAERPRLRTVFSGHLAATLQALARDGRGIAWLPNSLIVDDLREDRLRRAGDERWDVPVEIRLFRPAHALEPAAEAFWNGVVPG